MEKWKTLEQEEYRGMGVLMQPAFPYTHRHGNCPPAKPLKTRI